MNPDYAQLAAQAVDFLRDYIPHAATVASLELVFKEAGERGLRLLQLLKNKLTKPAAAGVFQEAVEAPAVPENWEALRLQILKALKEDEAFRRELLELFPAAVDASVRQHAAVTGDANVTVQVTAQGNQTNVGGGVRAGFRCLDHQSERKRGEAAHSKRFATHQPGLEVAKPLECAAFPRFTPPPAVPSATVISKRWNHAPPPAFVLWNCARPT
jgi:hypothetical protein